MEIADERPADILHGAADHHQCIHIHTKHLNQFTQTDHQTGGRHNCNNDHQYLAQFLQEVKIDTGFLLLFLNRFCGGSFLCIGNRLCCHLHHRILSGLYRTFHAFQVHLFRLIGNQYRSNRIDIFLFQVIQVHLCHQIAGLHLISHIHMYFETCTFQCNRFQSDMHQHFNTING